MDSEQKKRLLSELTDDEIQEELKRRDFDKTIPMALRGEDCDFTALKDYCIAGIRHIAQTARENEDGYGYKPKDFKHYIYEYALKAVFGDDIFKWMNEHTYD